MIAGFFVYRAQTGRAPAFFLFTSGIPPELAERVLALAHESGLDAGDIIGSTLRIGDSWEQEYRLIQAAVQQADKGEFVSQEEIEAVKRAYRFEV
ncbi:MAG: hypothetical protein GKR94_15035 [Gammaproteobacteria bacterium]|nr:hypothetical protein [Gammaproteobacteria bacterium]